MSEGTLGVKTESHAENWNPNLYLFQTQIKTNRLERWSPGVCGGGGGGGGGVPSAEPTQPLYNKNTALIIVSRAGRTAQTQHEEETVAFWEPQSLPGYVSRFQYI